MTGDPFAPPPEPAPPSYPALSYPAPSYPPPGYQPPGYQPPQYQSAGSQPQYAPPGYPPPGYPAVAPGAGYGYPAPPPAYGYPAVAPGHGKAVAGLVLGIIALVFCWLPILDVPVWILALVFSILGRSDAKKGAGGGGLAIGGLVCAILATIANIVISVTLFAVGISGENSCATQYGRGTTQYSNCMNN